MTTESKLVFENFVWRILQVFGKQGITFLIFILCSNELSLFEFGIYNYVLAFIFLLVLIGDLGISTATSKFVAEYSIDKPDKLKSVLFSSAALVLALTFVVFLFALMVSPSYMGENHKYVLMVLPLVFLAPMTSLYDGIFRGLKKFKKLAVITSFVGMLSIMVVIILINLYGLVGALLAQNFFYFILLIGLAFSYTDFNFTFNKEVTKEIGKYSLSYSVAVVGSYLLLRSIILLLGHYNYIEEIAIYELISKLFMILILPFTILGQVVAPDFSILSARKDFSNIYKKSKSYTIIFAFVGVISGLVLYFLFPPFFKLFFPEYYNNQIFQLTFTLLLITFVSNVWAATFDAGILVPTGYAWLMAKFYIALGIIVLPISIILESLFGYEGIIFSYTFVSIIMTVGLRTLYFKSFKSKTH